MPGGALFSQATGIRPVVISMTLPQNKKYRPMEAMPASKLPPGPEWQYEPKWDGFRRLAFRDGKRVDLESKAGNPLTRYFPELATAPKTLPAKQFVLDGEIVIQQGGDLSFDQLLMRIHPAASRVLKLSQESPAVFIVFDFLVDEKGKSLVNLPLQARREQLDDLRRNIARRANPSAFLRWPKTSRKRKSGFIWASGWTELSPSAVTFLTKRRAHRHAEGQKTRTADCVVGGFRYLEKSPLVGSLLLGLHNDEGRLFHVGFTSSIRDEDRPAITKRLEKLIRHPGFTGKAPGGLSRWSTKRSAEWQPVKPSLVVEVQFDHFTGGRFRHGTKFLRWRPEKAPQDCTVKHVQRQNRSALALL